MNKRHYISLWLLLLVAFGIVAVASCFEKIPFPGHDFKTATFMQQLCQAPEAHGHLLHDDSIFNDPIIGVASDSNIINFPAFPVPVDTASKTILFFGDSMLEGLSPRLAAYCNKNGHKLYTVIWYSSTTQVWGDCDTLSTFIRKYNPDYIIACLGANELFVRDIAAKRKAPLRHLLDEIGDRPLLWIGPPNWKEDTGINSLIEQTLEPGQFFLSDGMTFQRKSDGAHPTSTSAALWMDSVIRWMPTHCAHPIRLDIPDENRGRPDRVTLLQPVN